MFIFAIGLTVVGSGLKYEPNIRLHTLKKISLIIPCRDEEAALPFLYPELRKVTDSMPQYEWELLFVNDGSEDHTLDIVKDLQETDDRICYVDLSRNFGKESAMLAGFDYVTGDCAIIIDADMQDPPALIPEMIAYWEDGYEDVYARRRRRGKENWLRHRMSLLYYSVLQRSARFEMLRNVGDFRLLDRKCIDALKLLRETERYTKGLYCWIGFRKKEIEFDRGDRVAGTSSWNIRGLFDLGVDGLVSFSSSPLRYSTILGFITASGALVLLIYYLVKSLVYGDDVQGFPTLISVILFLGGVQLVSIGIIGEYMSRIFNETKNRPPYLIRKYSKPK